MIFNGSNMEHGLHGFGTQISRILKDKKIRENP
jgi:hypothetical protein